MAATTSRRASGRRRAMGEINMVPFIDVMLVLLIIFMVSAPLITTGVVDLPSVGQAARQPDRVIEVVLDASEALRLKVSGGPGATQGEGEHLRLTGLAARVRALQEGRNDVPVIISADKGVRYESVVRVMDTLQKAGVARVGLAVRTTGT
ncbi:MAG: ExbD/TolR family protein [Burkholderiales bacterium]